MNTKTLALLAASVVVIGAAALMLNRSPSAPGPSKTTPATLFPDLTSKVNDVASIEIKKPGETFTLTRTASGWALASKGNFPARVEQVKTTVVGISQLKPVEAKTSNPELYPRIGVQTPGDAPPPPAPPPTPDSTETPPTQPTLVTLKDAQGATLASLIVGTQKWGTPPTVFVRKADDPQSWLVEGELQVPTDSIEWIDRQVLNIPRERIKSVSVVHPATPDVAEVEVARAAPSETSFKLSNMPEGRELTAPTAPETLVSGVQYFNIDDVKPAGEIGFSQPEAISVFRTFDGLVITTQAVKKDATTWVNITAAFEEVPTPQPAPATPEANPTPPPAQKPADEVKKEAAELNSKLSAWAFAVPDYKAKNLTATVETLLKPTAAPVEPPTPIGPEPAGPSQK